MLIKIAILACFTLIILQVYQINEGKARKVKIGGKSYKLRHPFKFYKESFSFTKCAPPEGHFEQNTFIVAGDIQSGKSFASAFFAYLCSKIWPGDIDFFDCKDIFQTIEAVKKSTFFAHFILIDDAIRQGLDSRRSMSGANLSASQQYFVIRHLVKEGYLNEGYLIICIVAQDYKRIDKSIRHHSSFIVFKTHDEGCEDLIENPKIIDLLKFLKDQSTRVKNAKIRKWGVAVALDKKLTLIEIPSRFGKWTPKTFVKTQFIKVKMNTALDNQVRELIDFLMQRYPLMEELPDHTTLKGDLDFELDRMKDRHTFVQVNSNHYTEIIRRVKSLRYAGIKTMVDKLKEVRQEQMDELVEVLFSRFKETGIPPSGTTKGILDTEVEITKADLIKETHYTKIIKRAKAKVYEYQESVKLDREKERVEGAQRQKELLIDYLFQRFKTKDLPPTRTVKGIMDNTMRDILEKGDIFIEDTHYTEIIQRADARIYEYQESLEVEEVEEHGSTDRSLEDLDELKLRGMGYSNRDIAKIKTISPSTVQYRIDKQKEEQELIIASLNDEGNQVIST